MVGQKIWEKCQGDGETSLIEAITEASLMLVKYRTFSREKVVQEVMIPLSVDDTAMVAYRPKVKGIHVLKMKNILFTQPIKLF